MKRMKCPGCGHEVYLDPVDGWRNDSDGFTCDPPRTTHSQHILEGGERSHAEHITVTNAYWADCLEGECEHRDEDGEPEDMSACPPVPPFEVCVDCMDEAGAGRDPAHWDDVALTAWPHPVSTDSGERR